MSVVGVTHDWISESCDVQADPSNGQYQGTIVDVYKVDFDTSDPVEMRKILALNAQYNGVTVPAFNSSYHEAYPWMYCTGKQVRSEGGPQSYIVTVTFTYVPDPTTLPASVLITFGSEASEFDVGFDKDGNVVPITNSAGEAFDPPLNRDFHDLIVSISQAERLYGGNVLLFDVNGASVYLDAVNSDTFLGFAAGKVKLKGVKATRVYAQTTYNQVEYEFHIRTDQSDILNIGWLRRVLDQGYRKNVNGQITEFTDSNGKRVTQPVLLNGSGDKLADTAAPVYREFRDYDMLPFGSVFALRGVTI